MRTDLILTAQWQKPTFLPFFFTTAFTTTPYFLYLPALLVILTLLSLHMARITRTTIKIGRYRNPLRQRQSPRSRWVRMLDDTIRCQLMMAYQRCPVSLPHPELFQRLLELRNKVKTARYLIRPKHKRVLSSHYRTDVLSSEDEDYFKTAFRMNETQFDCIVNLIKDASVFKSRGRKPQKPVADQLKVALHRFCHDGSLSSLNAVGRQLGVSVGSVVRYTRRCASALCSLKKDVVRWTTTEQEKSRIKRHLGKGRFSDAIGAVDGTMIPIFRAPTLSRDTFATRKSNFAMGATGVADHRSMFTFFYTGYVGTKHDSSAYKDTPLYKKKEDYFSGGEYLLADAAYALTPTVIAAYKGRHQPPPRQQFNKALSSSRVKIEHAFGLLKGRWASLRHLRMDHDTTSDMRRIVQHIHACVVIHNILLSHPELESDYESGSDDSGDGSDSDNDGSDDDSNDENVGAHGTDLQDDDIEDDGQVYIDYPWHEFESLAERTRFERHQRILGQRKRERLRERMQ